MFFVIHYFQIEIKFKQLITLKALKVMLFVIYYPFLQIRIQDEVLGSIVGRLSVCRCQRSRQLRVKQSLEFFTFRFILVFAPIELCSVRKPTQFFQFIQLLSVRLFQFFSPFDFQLQPASEVQRVSAGTVCRELVPAQELCRRQVTPK
jgi:hypothetical protein